VDGPLVMLPVSLLQRYATKMVSLQGRTCRRRTERQDAPRGYALRQADMAVRSPEWWKHLRRTKRRFWKKQSRRYKLEQLLVEPQDEIDWGPPRGKEVW